MRFGFVLFAAAGAAALAPVAVAPPVPRSPERLAAVLDVLVAAYPQALARHDGERLFWHKGPPTPVGDPAAKRTTSVILATPEIADIFAWPYPLGNAQGMLGDPGRARPAVLFTRLYGDCRSAPVPLVPVRWVGGRTVRFAATAGAAEALAAVARDLEALGPSAAKYLWPIAGTYNCRTIAGTGELSMHAYGTAIDLNPKWGAYWRWSARPAPAQTLPAGIVAAFERHGFIWGGKWAHFDSFHFEYRPELIRAARRVE